MEDKQGHAGTPVIRGVARVLLPNRAQVELRASDLESLLPEGHRAQVVWGYVEQADLSRIYAGIKAVEGGSGRTPIAPEILFALWLYATVEGVGSARAIARLNRPSTISSALPSADSPSWSEASFPCPGKPRARAYR